MNCFGGGMFYPRPLMFDIPAFFLYSGMVAVMFKPRELGFLAERYGENDLSTYYPQFKLGVAKFRGLGPLEEKSPDEIPLLHNCSRSTILKGDRLANPGLEQP